MQLFTRFPKTRKFTLIDPKTGYPDYSKTYVLHPDEPTEVEDSIADKLLKQDPHLISNVPYSELKPEEKFGRTPTGFSEEFGREHEKLYPELPPDEVTDNSLKAKTPDQNEGTKIQTNEPGLTAGLLPDEETVRKLEILQDILNDGGVETLPGKKLDEYAEKLGLDKLPKKLADKRAILDAECQRIYDSMPTTGHIGAIGEAAGENVETEKDA